MNDYPIGKGLLSFYTKSDIKVLERRFIPYYRTAVNNAKLASRRLMADDNIEDNIYLIWERNFSSNVFMLIETLRLEKMNHSIGKIR